MVLRCLSIVARFFSFGKGGWMGGGFPVLVHSPPLPPVACSLERVHSCSELWREREREMLLHCSPRVQTVT